MNHSDSPNTVSAVINGEELTIAARDIAIDEELTCDYSEFDLLTPQKVPFASK
jgi:SET domain-containing protein